MKKSGKFLTLFIIAVLVAVMLVSAVACKSDNEYTIKFYADDTYVGSVVTAGKAMLSFPDAPEKVGYTFMGWYTDKGEWKKQLTADSYINTPVTESFNVYAYYVKNSQPQPEEYVITFYDGAVVVGTVTTAGNETITLPEAPHKQGYEFAGWYLDKDVWSQEFTADTYKDKPLTGNVSVYAYYKVITYKVSFETYGGSPVAAKDVSVIEDSPFTSRDGYDFAGWYLDEEFNEKVQFPFYPSQDTVLHAKWEPKTVEFTLDSSGFITGMSGVPEDGVLFIPSTVNGVKVKGVASYAFKENQDIIRVEVDPDIVDLGVECFRNCKNLTEVKLSDKMTVLPEGIFDGCSSLTQIQLPSSLVEIRSDALCGIGITDIVLPGSVRSIWSYAFKDCRKLVSIDLGNVKYVGQGVFQYCESLKKIVFPDTLEEVDGNYMFRGCSSLTEIVLPEKPLSMNYTFLNETAYYNDHSNWDKGVLYVGSFLITVGNDFKDTPSYTVKQGTICIADNAFNNSYCTGALQTVVLPEGLIEIGKQAFYSCAKLTDINIPQSVVRVGNSAFASTPIIKKSESTYLDGWLLSYYASGDTVTVQDGTIGIADGKILSSSSSVTKVILPQSLKYIGEENFSKFTSLESITMPSSLVSIGNRAFNSCKKIQEIDLSGCDQLQSIGDYAFSWCSSIKEFYICASVSKLGEGVFNQIAGVVVNFEIQEDQIPEGFSSSWDYTYADIPVQANWGVAKN